MKRIGNIYKNLSTEENILAAIKKAASGKHKRRSVQRVLADLAGHVLKIKTLLENKTYKPCRVREHSVKEGARQKQRQITKIDFFPDQIIHWCLIRQLQPFFVKSAYSLSAGSMPERGVHYAQKFIERWLQRDRKNTKYVAKLDISKFYPSIPHKTMKTALARKFKDRELLWLLNSIVDHWHAPGKPGVGLPIGFLTSQWFANYLLQPIDYLIKQELRAKYYVRYMDDMVIFGRNKKRLHSLVKNISLKLKSFGLSLKSNWQIFRPASRSIDFMGFRFFCQKTTLRRSLMLRISKKCRTVTKKHAPSAAESASIISYMGWIKHSDSNGLFRKRIKPFVSIKQAKKAVALAAKANIKGDANENCAIRVNRNAA